MKTRPHVGKLEGLALVALAFVCALAAKPALACAACGTQKAENDWAFGATTLFLSLFPPLMFGGFVFFVVRMGKRAAQREADAEEPPPLPHPVSTEH